MRYVWYYMVIFSLLLPTYKVCDGDSSRQTGPLTFRWVRHGVSMLLMATTMIIMIITS
jgi:hypothetical protein